MQTVTNTQQAIVPTNTAIANMQAQQAKLQAQINALQAQQQALHNLQQNIAQGEYFVVKPSNAQTNTGVQNLPKFVTLVLQALPLVTGSNALMPQQIHAITQLLLQACSMVEQQGNIPLAQQRIAQG